MARLLQFAAFHSVQCHLQWVHYRFLAFYLDRRRRWKRRWWWSPSNPVRSSGFNSPPPELEVEEEEVAEAEVWMRKRQKTGAGLLQALTTRTCRSEGRVKASTLANSKLFARLVRLEVDEGHLATGPSVWFRATRCGCLAARLGRSEPRRARRALHAQLVSGALLSIPRSSSSWVQLWPSPVHVMAGKGRFSGAFRVYWSAAPGSRAGRCTSSSRPRRSTRSSSRP